MNDLILAITAPINQEMNMWDMIFKGGWLMIPIFILSIIGVYIIFERYFTIKKTGSNNSALLHKVMGDIRCGNKTAALQKCSSEDTPLTRTLRKGIQYADIPRADLRAALENTASSEISDLEKGLPTLATVAGMAPMIGFLGTVVGMVQAFYDMAQAGNNINITLLSRGIYTAMITTVAGLIVGIIAYFGYNALVSKIDKITNQLENACSEFINSLYDADKLK